MRTALLTLTALLSFAGNSVLCRLALDGSLMDASGFTSVRLVAGAFTLAILYLISNKQKGALIQLITPSVRHLKSTMLLFVYATSFSFAYLTLDTGSGALILFGSVQLTLFLASYMTGKRPTLIEWLGLGLSFMGLVYLMLPAWGAPTLIGFVLMVFSGFAWGLYTLAGKGSKQPLLETSKSFVFCIPLVLVLNLFAFYPMLWTGQGLILATLSGALTSGVGYVIWYAVLPKLSLSQAGILQLLVPVLAALGGVVFTAEVLNMRLVVSAVLVLGGVYLVLIYSQERQMR